MDFLDIFVNVSCSRYIVDSIIVISHGNPYIDLNCVVVSINYRHAPEHCYPVAINDSFAGLKWVLTPDTATRLSINTTKLAIGGLSA